MIDRWLWGAHLAPKSHLFSGFAASIAFYLILSITPLLAVALGLALHLLPVNLTHNIAQLVDDFIPSDTILNVDSLIHSASSVSGKGLLTITTAFALWSASNFTMQIVNALRFIFTAALPGDPKGWVNRLLSFLLLFLWATLLLLAAMAMLVGPLFEQGLAQVESLGTSSLMLLKIFRHSLALLVLTFMFWIAYRVTSGKRYATARLLHASLIATAGWVLLGWVYSRVLAGIWTTSALYGALGSVIATLLWAYLSAWLILLGACYVVRRHPCDFPS